MKYIKSIILCFIIFYLYGCQETPVIHKMHVDILENQLDTIKLSDYTDFDWDRALFFNDYLTCAYHEKDFIEKTYNFSLNALSLSKYEFAIPVVFIKDGRIVHVEVFENFISICNTGRNEYALKLKGTKKCNLQFAVFGAKASSFSIIRAI